MTILKHSGDQEKQLSEWLSSHLTFTVKKGCDSSHPGLCKRLDGLARQRGVGGILLEAASTNNPGGTGITLIDITDDVQQGLTIPDKFQGDFLRREGGEVYLNRFLLGEGSLDTLALLEELGEEGYWGRGIGLQLDFHATLLSGENHMGKVGYENLWMAEQESYLKHVGGNREKLTEVLPEAILAFMILDSDPNKLARIVRDEKYSADLFPLNESDQNSLGKMLHRKELILVQSRMSELFGGFVSRVGTRIEGV